MNPALKKLLFRSDLLVSLRNHIGFYKRHGRLPRKTGSLSFNDHFFQIKDTIGRDALRKLISDKEFVKSYIKDKLGDAYNIPTIAVLKTPEEALAFFQQEKGGKRVIKPTHMSGQTIFTDAPLSDEQIKKALGWFKQNYFYNAGEANYRDLQPKIIVEQFVDFDGEAVPKDYKCFCAHGRVVMIQVNQDRFGHERKTLYSPDWQFLPFVVAGVRGGEMPRPTMLPDMIRVAEILSKDFSVIRVDLYVGDKKVLIGELTNVHEDACGIFTPPEAENLVGRVFSNPELRIVDLI